MKDVAIEKFNEEGISFNKYYWKQDDKLEVAKNENIDVMMMIHMMFVKNHHQME